MEPEKIDAFLQTATLTLHDVWTNAGGRELSEHELQALNDTLTTYFSDVGET